MFALLGMHCNTKKIPQLTFSNSEKKCTGEREADTKRVGGRKQQLQMKDSFYKFEINVVCTARISLTV